MDSWKIEEYGISSKCGFKDIPAKGVCGLTRSINAPHDFCKKENCPLKSKGGE